MPSVSENDRENHHEISGRISRESELFPGSERSVSDDPDRRYGRLQQCQPFCRRFSETVRVQSRRIQFFEAAETEKGLCRVFIIERVLKNCDSALVVIDTDIDIYGIV